MPAPTKLEQFSSSFASEAELRTAIIGLLERLPNATGLRHTHGVLERGKDIVFNVSDAFGESRLIGCVIKNSKITGAADSKSGARTVYIQAEQVLDTAIADPSGQEQRIEQVYVISPYECSPDAVDSIKGKLQLYKGRVRFLCGRDLMRAFETHYPEYLLFRSGLFGSYASDLERGLDTDDAVANLLFSHGFSGGTEKLRSIFIRPRFVRELCIHRLIVPKIKIKKMHEAMTSEDAESFQTAFRNVGELVFAIEMPDAHSHEVKSLADELAEQLRSAWQDAVDAHRRRRNVTDTAQQHFARDTALTLSGDVVRDLGAAAEKLLRLAEPTISEFKRKVETANLFVQHPPEKPADILRAEKMARYCDVESVSIQVPWLVRAESPVRVVDIPETLIHDFDLDFLITGPAGFGKTSFCSWETLYDLDLLREDRSNVLPVYVRLHQLAHRELGSFTGTFLSTPALATAWDQRRKKSKTRPPRRFRLYLDGLDEVPSVERQQTLLHIAEQGKQEEPSTHIIVTGRDHVAGKHLRHLCRIKIRELDDDQVNALVDKWFKGQQNATKGFFQELQKFPALRPLMRVPLLGTLIINVYRSSKSLPDSRLKLYDMFLNLLAGGWDAAKNVHRSTKFGPTPKLIILSRLAGILHMGTRRDCTEIDIRGAISYTLPGLLPDSDVITEELVQDGLLMPIGAAFAFPHLSFQEFLAAKDLLEPSGRKAEDAIKLYLTGKDWWREVILFYLALTGKPREMATFVRSIAGKIVARDVPSASVQERRNSLLDSLVQVFPGARPIY